MSWCRWDPAPPAISQGWSCEAVQHATSPPAEGRGDAPIHHGAHLRQELLCPRSPRGALLPPWVLPLLRFQKGIEAGLLPPVPALPQEPTPLSLSVQGSINEQEKKHPEETSTPSCRMSYRESTD